MNFNNYNSSSEMVEVKESRDDEDGFENNIKEITDIDWDP